MSLLIKTEKAFQQYLLGLAEFLVAADGTFVKSDTGLLIKLASGFMLNMPIVTDVNRVAPLETPAVICSCRELREPTQLFQAKVFQGNAVITLVMSANDWTGAPDVLVTYEYAARELAKALYRPDLAFLLTQKEPDFTCIEITAERAERHTTDGRLRKYEFTIPIIVAHGKLHEPPPP